jgi:hypothetical protein
MRSGWARGFGCRSWWERYLAGDVARKMSRSRCCPAKGLAGLLFGGRAAGRLTFAGRMGLLALLSSQGPGWTTLAYEFRFHQRWNDACRVAAGEKLGHGFAAAGAEIERPVVDVHADECVGFAVV